MITYEMIKNAQEIISTNWGNEVIEVCAKQNSLNMTSKEFINHCTACGGNWGGMLLSGLHKLVPEVWDAIPNDMGVHAWSCICSTLVLCGVDTSE